MVAEQTRIMDYNPKFILLLHDREAYDLIRDDNHKTVLSALRDRPLTVKELVKRYEELAGTTKSDKTIYRYLNNLQNAGLVEIAGQLVTKGKKTNETIYGRTATIFHLYPIKTLGRNPEKLDIIAKGVSLLLQKEDQNTENIKNIEDIKDIILVYEDRLQDKLAEFGRENTAELEEFFMDLDPYQIEKIMDISSNLALIKEESKLQDKLKRL